jgi:hypothetical protein
MRSGQLDTAGYLPDSRDAGQRERQVGDRDDDSGRADQRGGAAVGCGPDRARQQPDPFDFDAGEGVTWPVQTRQATDAADDQEHCPDHP